MSKRADKLIERDMIKGDPAKALIYFAVPLVLGNLFQQLYNMIDSIIVGNFVGAEALAAVGASASITFLFVALATGMSIGSTVVISQYLGAKEYTKMKTAITTVIFTVLLISIILMSVGIALNQSILKLMNTPDNIMADASAYLKIYFYGLVFLFMYNIFTAVFNALGDSKKPLYFLIFSSVLNVGLDIYFVTVFQMGVAGVAWATLIAQALSAILSFIVLIFKLKKLALPMNAPLYQWNILKHVFKVAVPSTIQQSIVSLGMILVQTLVNGYGNVVVAGYTAATKIDSIAIMPMIAVGNAMSTFVAQNMGAKHPDRIKKGYKAAMSMIAVVSLTITTILFIWGENFIGAFVNAETNQDMINVGVEYLRVVSIFYFLMGSMNVTSGILRGAGDIRIYMLNTFGNFTTRVILAYALAGFLGQSAIWYSIPVGWFVGFSISWIRYRSGKWKQKTVI